MQDIFGTIKNIVYQNKDTGYTILRTTKNITLCGTLYDVGIILKEADFIAKGEWKRHKKHGTQFYFEDLSITEGELFYFLSRIVRGLGKKLAKHLIEKYGEKDLEDILENNPEKLIETKGIRHKKLNKIVSSWNKFKHLKSIADIIIPNGGTQSLVKRIYLHFKEDLQIIPKIKSNPYIITEVPRIGFKTADKIARAMGINPHGSIRIKACIDFIILSYTIERGNSCIEIETLFELLNEEIAFIDQGGNTNTILKEELLNNLSAMKEKKKIVWLTDKKITSTFLYNAEKFILETVIKKGHLKQKRIIEDIESYISQKSQEMGMIFSDEQKQAMQLANENYELFILCGYAGTGKSTISKAILDILVIKYKYHDIICCALSGIAADRIRKTTGYQGVTIQSLLVKIMKEGKNLPYKVILIDESSMINTEIMYKLFQSSAEGTKFILVGDPAQLPPIGAGDPFQDIINFRVLNTVELIKIYRQSEDKVVTLLANQIRQAKVPEKYNKEYEDFKFIDISIENYFAIKKQLSTSQIKQMRETNNENILLEILSLFHDHKNNLLALKKTKKMKEYISYFQIITPVKNGVLGARNINIHLQEKLNPQIDVKKIIDLGIIKFNIFDKVIHIINKDMDCYLPADFKRNDRTEYLKRKRIFNGMIGILFKLDKEEELLWVFYPNDEVVVEYTFDEARELLSLAYALTIHKTQGSEYANVIIPITLSHYIMLNNKLLYTAITRAKGKCIIIGERYAFTSSCKRKDTNIRNTVMNIEGFAEQCSKMNDLSPKLLPQTL
ncbi:MAG: AAA family ATPase [bacterium]|nr:AAA family ATPase [bacterium]